MEERYIRSAEILWDQLPGDIWLRGIPALRSLGRLRFDRNITFFAGENGTGKSTLLEGIAVACGFNPEGGTIHYHFSTFDEGAGLGQALQVSRGYKRPPFGYFFRAESFFNVASQAEVYRHRSLGEISKEVYYARYGGHALHEQSHGESFLAWFQSCSDQGLYLMDEPEAALSPMRQLSLIAEIHRLVQNDSQLLIATHSPILMAFPDADIYLLTDDGIQKTTYEQTEHYLFTKRFLENPNKILRHLFENNNE